MSAVWEVGVDGNSSQADPETVDSEMKEGGDGGWVGGGSLLVTLALN